MAEEIKEKITISAAKRYILNELKVTKEMIDSIKTNEEAEELIEYLKKKENSVPKKEEKKEEIKMQLKANMGTKPSELGLPDPEELNHPIKNTLEDALNPLSVRKARNNLYITGARLLHRGGNVF